MMLVQVVAVNGRIIDQFELHWGKGDHILFKPGPLNEAELEKIRTHPRLGAEIVSGILPAGQALAVVRSHHERWDGRGYPDGLRGEAIPLAARIFAVADTL